MLAYRVEPVPGDPYKFMIFDKETGKPVNIVDRMVMKDETSNALDQLVQISEEMGGYDLD